MGLLGLASAISTSVNFALVKRIRQTPPIEVRRLFDYVRDDVLKATGKKQQPFSYGSISAEEDFYFLPPK